MASEKILVVDDQENFTILMKRILERLGYSVITLTRPLEALDLFKCESDQFDLVITDLNMPKMNGDKLVREFIKIRPDILVILCTGDRKFIERKDAKEMGIEAILPKPFRIKDVKSSVQSVLHKGKVKHDSWHRWKCKGERL